MYQERMMRWNIREQWWEHCSGIMRFMPKVNGQTLRDVIKCLEKVKEWGFDAIEIFAPYYGGNEYGGLDVYNYCSIDPQKDVKVGIDSPESDGFYGVILA